MVRVNVFNLVTLALTFLAFMPKIESQIRPHPVIPSLPPPSSRPLCGPQLALVTYACARVAFTPGSPPPPDDIDNDNEEHHRSHHRHGHRHRHHRRHSPQEDNCCRWAREMDSRCVCEILVRLPIFLTRPLHQYSVMIGESCNVTYTCGGPI